MSTIIQMTKTLKNPKVQNIPFQFNIQAMETEKGKEYTITQIGIADSHYSRYNLANTKCDGKYIINDNFLYLTFDIVANPQSQGLGTLLLDCTFFLIEELERMYNCTFHSLYGWCSHADADSKWKISIPFYCTYNKKMNPELKYTGNLVQNFMAMKHYNHYYPLDVKDLYTDPSNMKKVMFTNSAFANTDFAVTSDGIILHFHTTM